MSKKLLKITQNLFQFLKNLIRLKIILQVTTMKFLWCFFSILRSCRDFFTIFSNFFYNFLYILMKSWDISFIFLQYFEQLFLTFFEIIWTNCVEFSTTFITLRQFSQYFKWVSTLTIFWTVSMFFLRNFTNQSNFYINEKVLIRFLIFIKLSPDNLKKASRFYVKIETWVRFGWKRKEEHFGSFEKVCKKLYDSKKFLRFSQNPV